MQCYPTSSGYLVPALVALLHFPYEPRRVAAHDRPGFHIFRDHSSCAYCGPVAYSHSPCSTTGKLITWPVPDLLSLLHAGDTEEVNPTLEDIAYKGIAKVLSPRMMAPPPTQTSSPMVMGRAYSGPFRPSLRSGSMGWPGG